MNNELLELITNWSCKWIKAFLSFLYFWHSTNRSQMIHKIGIHENFAKFSGQQVCRSFSSNKNIGLQPATYWKGDPAKVDPVNFAKFLRSPFLSPGRILQNIYSPNSLSAWFPKDCNCLGKSIMLSHVNKKIDKFDFS